MAQNAPDPSPPLGGGGGWGLGTRLGVKLLVKNAVVFYDEVFRYLTRTSDARKDAHSELKQKGISLEI